MVKAELIWQMVPGDNAVGCVCMALVQHEQAFVRLQSVLGWCSWWRKKVWHPTSSTSSRPFSCTDVLFTPHWKRSVHLPCGLDVIYSVECLINAAPLVIFFFDSLCNIMITISGWNALEWKRDFCMSSIRWRNASIRKCARTAFVESKSVALRKCHFIYDLALVLYYVAFAMPS